MFDLPWVTTGKFCYGKLHRSVGQKFPDVSAIISFETLPNCCRFRERHVTEYKHFVRGLRVFDIAGLKRDLDRRERRVDNDTLIPRKMSDPANEFLG